jgi:hypothetical protein
MRGFCSVITDVQAFLSSESSFACVKDNPRPRAPKNRLPQRAMVG